MILLILFFKKNMTNRNIYTLLSFVKAYLIDIMFIKVVSRLI